MAVRVVRFGGHICVHRLVAIAAVCVILAAHSSSSSTTSSHPDNKRAQRSQTRGGRWDPRDTPQDHRSRSKSTYSAPPASGQYLRSSTSDSGSTASSSSSSLPRRGSLRYMPKLQRMLIRQGATLNNSFVSTPMCCPSRSTFLSGMRGRQQQHYQRRQQQQQQQWRGRGRGRSSKPNIVVILTDDQDVLLGSLRYMPKLQRMLIRQGATLNNSFVSTPMCCPSRSTFLSGMYVHNHNVYTNNANCSGAEWQSQHEPRAFPNYVNSTYRTGYFGKYLNDYFGGRTPPGWHRWMGLIRNSRFYNYSLVDETGRVEKHGDNYYNDYLTDLVARRGTSWLRESKRTRPTDPVMMVLSVPAPHGPEDAAPQYQHMFVNNTDHRTPAWNYAPNPDKQWLLQYKSPMTPQFKIFTDLLQRRRLQTLQSVDDLVEMVVNELERLGELDNTYILYTSDHGYHLGQFGLIKGKAMPFDFDTRVPLIIRGPGIPRGVNISNIVINADMAPTLIDMAGHSIPDHMDGQSVLRLLKAVRDPKNVDDKGFVKLRKPWKHSVLFERGKLTEKVLRQRERTEEMIIFNQAEHNKEVHFYIPTRRRKLAIECSKATNRLPCKPQQKWYCIEENGRLKKHKCRGGTGNGTDTSSSGVMLRDQPRRYHSCPCTPLPASKADIGGSRIVGASRRGGKKSNRTQRRRQRRLKKRHLIRGTRARFTRKRRSADGEEAYGLSTPIEFSGLESLFDRRCRILANQTVLCDLDIYKNPSEWAIHKEKIDAMIREYRKALDDLRDIRRHLREQRPLFDIDGDGEGDEDVGEGEKKGRVDKTSPGAGGCLCDDTGKIVARRKGKGAGVSIPPGLTKSERRDMRRQLRRNQRQQKTQRKRKRKKTCNTVNMNCFTHDNHHWKTPPYWNYGPFCFCSNANNNTYWCLRTINQTHDFVYCEFITTFMSFYDLLTDPHQLKNTVTELNYGVLQQLHEELELMKTCKGRQECALRSTATRRKRLQHQSDWPGLISIRRSKARRHRYNDHRGGPRRAFRAGLRDRYMDSRRRDGFEDIDAWMDGDDLSQDFDVPASKWSVDYE
ncbi:extracellular sulfatase Sulf-2 [Elysia marginata]|uniref:Extracellular sulfatase Sulf-2 n=1 Tax=Elysia marginata TaxID=1093978 RepID=A0AAV4J886_9GAST|nr:extracellular sulfatase Sulf-2 [Elysia marginata]